MHEHDELYIVSVIEGLKLMLIMHELDELYIVSVIEGLSAPHGLILCLFSIQAWEVGTYAVLQLDFYFSEIRRSRDFYFC